MKSFNFEEKCTQGCLGVLFARCLQIVSIHLQTMYNCLTICKQIADVELLVLCGNVWSHLCADRYALASLEYYLLSICLEISGLICV